MLKCRVCNQLKSVESFSKMSKAASGRQSECKACASVRMTKWYNSLTEEQKTVRKVRTRTHRQANPESYYWNRIKRQYGLTKDQFNELLESQGYKCAICGTLDPQGVGRWCVDHNHICCPGIGSCGQCIRGLLCNGCNHGLGNFRDSRESLLAAVNYLEQRD